MLKIDRQNFIENELKKKGSVLISELSGRLDCSEETIRRDLKEMESENKLKRIHGGAFLPEKYDKGVPIRLRETFLVEEKQRMVGFAIKSIKENDVIMLDSSTTCLKLAQAIFDLGIAVTIITNSFKICDAFSQCNSPAHVISTGGTLYTKNCSFIGYKALDTLESFVADKAFISCPYIDIKYGLSDNNQDAAMVRKTMLNQSIEKCIIADHTKFSNVSTVAFYNLKEIHTIITDEPLSKEWMEQCREFQIDVQCC